MNTSRTAYTPLESLLLFQSLAAYGVEPSIFSRISELLKKNPHISSADRFESGRLSPDALRNFYLQILKEEIKSEIHDGEAQNGEVRNARKRKAPSPSLPSAHEAAQHAHLIPKLVTRLYARYRSFITEQIREDERRYDRLQRELREIERGEWDHKLRPQEKVNGKSPIPQSQAPSRTPPVIVQQKENAPPTGPQAGIADGPVNVRTVDKKLPDGLQQPPQNGQFVQERVPAVVAASSPQKRQALQLDQRAPAAPSASTPQLPQIPVPTPQQHRPNQPSPAPRFPPPPQTSGPGHNGSHSPTHLSPYPPQIPHPPVSQGPVVSSGPNIPAHVHPTLPPPAAVLSAPHGLQYPPQHVPPYGGNGVPQYSGPPPGPPLSQFSPTQQRFPGPYLPPGPQSPGVQTPPHPRPVYSHFPGQQQRRIPSSHAIPQMPPQHTPQPPHQGGVMLPPFQVAPQDPRAQQQQPQHTQQPHSQQHQQHQQPPATYAPLSAPVTPRPQIGPLNAYNTNPNSARTGPPLPNPYVTQFREQYSTPQNIRTPPSVRSVKTVWKSTVKINRTSPIPPPPVSPIEDDVLLEEFKKLTTPKAKPVRKSRAKPKAQEKEVEKEKAPESQPPIEAPSVEPEKRPARAGRKKAPTPRLANTASPVVESIRGYSRSQSVASRTETMSVDNESTLGYQVKTEPRASVDIPEEDQAATPSHSAASRRRAQAPQANKRKRATRAASIAESEDLLLPTPGPRTVIAPRHFSRMCNPIMNDIASNKHASTFIAPVKPKDAEGYYDIIKRPTDLKTIQKAITAGAKIVGQAASALDSTASGNSPGGGGGNVVLPLSADVVPPKAIVNSGQLEKELMRMFVNAVMFNAGEEGLVEDTREMFENVQQSVSNWRSAERSTGGLETAEDLVVPEEDGPTASKRRKL